MARIALSLPQFTEPVSGAVRWADETAGLGDVSDLRASAGSAHLTSILIRPLANGRVVMQVRETVPGGGAGGGPDLTAAWEQSPHALTLRAPGVSDLVIPGPDHASSANRDTTEPYGWRVAAASVAAHTAWRTAFLALPSAQQQAAQVILDDGGTLAGIARSRIRTRGALDAVAKQGGIVQVRARTRGALAVSIRAGLVHSAEGETLDEIAWRRYRRHDAVPAVLAANPGLADAPPALPAGLAVVLPDLPASGLAMSAARLWNVAPVGVTLSPNQRPYARLGGTFRATVRVR